MSAYVTQLRAIGLFYGLSRRHQGGLTLLPDGFEDAAPLEQLE